MVACVVWPKNPTLCTVSQTIMVAEGMNTTLQTALGVLRGSRLANGVEAFLGIPFAEPPARFEDPVLWTKPWHEAWDARAFASVCVQPTDPTRSAWIGSEDCLYLNVWRRPSPVEAGAALRPVLLFIHGGAFINGGGQEYNASVLASKHDAVYVTINYRLDALGWLQVSPGRANFGLKDQRCAMRWVQAHADAFGGDRRRVMIFGESAGAMSIALHLLSPRSIGLFHGALMESGMAEATFQPAALRQGDQFAALVAHCDRAPTPRERLGCLQRAPLALLCNASRGIAPPASAPMWDPASSGMLGPSVDGDDVLAPPQQLLREGRLPLSVPVVAGVNTNEGAGFAYPYLPTGALGPTEYVGHVRQLISKFQAARVDGGPPTAPNETVVRRALALYPPVVRAAGADTSPDSAPVLERLLTDLIFHCATRRLARALSSPTAHRNGSAVWLYRFDVRARDDSTPLRWGVSHGSDVPFAFDRGDWVGGPALSSFTPAEEAFSTWMGAAWARFAAVLQPGSPPIGPPQDHADAPDADDADDAGGGAAAVHAQPTQPDGRGHALWPAYDPSLDEQMVLQTGQPPLRPEQSPRAAACGLWESLGWF